MDQLEGHGEDGGGDIKEDPVGFFTKDEILRRESIFATVEIVRGGDWGLPDIFDLISGLEGFVRTGEIPRPRGDKLQVVK